MYDVGVGQQHQHHNNILKVDENLIKVKFLYEKFRSGYDAIVAEWSKAL